MTPHDPYVLLVTDRPNKLPLLEAHIKASRLKLTEVRAKVAKGLSDWHPSHHPPELVIEYVPSRHGLKHRVIQEIDLLLPKEVPILSAVTDCMASVSSSWLQHPERLAGFSPFQVKSPLSSLTLCLPEGQPEQSKERFISPLLQLDLKHRWIQDTPGLVTGRIYAMLVNEAAFALQEHVASCDDIDIAMQLGTNYPMGPLQWADQVGVDVVYDLLEHLWSIYRQERYRPCLLLRKLIEVGHLGQHTGRGFYSYEPMPASVESSVIGAS